MTLSFLRVTTHLCQGSHDDLNSSFEQLCYRACMEFFTVLEAYTKSFPK